MGRDRARIAEAHAGFDGIVARHEQEVLRICCAVLHDEHLGRDAMQETFVKLWRGGPAAADAGGRGAWLRRVALTSAIDLARRNARRGRVLAAAGEEAVDDASHGPDLPAPMERLFEAELDRHLRSAVARLPERQREIFTLRHDHGLPLREVARRLDLGVTTVKTQFSRACWKLQARLAPLLREDHEEPGL